MAETTDTTTTPLSTRTGDRRLQRLACGLATTLLVIAIAGCEGYLQSTIDPATSDFGQTIQGLYTTVFWWSMFILAVVWALLAVILIRFRDRPEGAEPKRTRGNLALEIGWTLGPAVIVVLISVPSIQAVFETQRPAPADALRVEVIGHQWWWEFRYPDQDVVTANELHVPVGRTVELELRSADVIHSFWVPRLGGKRDVMPRVRQPEGAPEPPNFNRLVFTVSEPGTYHGQCAEFCGMSHALMGMRVIAHQPERFADWVRRMNAPSSPDPGTLADRGREIFATSVCVACHAIQGTNARGTLGPNLTRVGARGTIGAGLLENTPENLIRWIRDPGAIKPGAKMPGAAEPGGGMAPTGMTDEEIEAVAAYLSSLE